MKWLTIAISDTSRASPAHAGRPASKYVNAQSAMNNYY